MIYDYTFFVITLILSEANSDKIREMLGDVLCDLHKFQNNLLARESIWRA